MGPDPATSKSRGSRYRSNESQHSRVGESLERGSQRSDIAKGKSDKDGGGTESGRGQKRRQHGGGGDGGQTTISVSGSGSHRSSKRWRADALEALDVLNNDRWDGGASDTPKENVMSSVKSKQDSDLRSGEGIIGKSTNAQLAKDGGDVEKTSRKQKVSKASLVADSRAITVMDLQEADSSVIDTNIRIKNKVSYRREATLEVADPEHEKISEENAKNALEVSMSRGRRRWDKDGHKGSAEDTDDGHARSSVVGEGNLERERKKEKVRDRDRDSDVRIQNGRKSGEGSRDPAPEFDGRLEISDELEHSNEFKIQEELRNIELERELENRIRRRREESGDRDRWRDDDREREGKRHSDSREDRPRDERHREDRPRRDRHSDRHESRQHREGSKTSDGRPKEDRYYESDREYKSHRDERYHGGRSKDLEDQSRGDRTRDQEHRDRKSRENVSGGEAERRTRDKSYKDDAPEKEKSYSVSAYVEPLEGAKSEHRLKRTRESDPGDGYGAERDHSRQKGRPGESDPITGSDVIHDDRPRRNREDRDGDGRLDRSRGSPRDHDGLHSKGKSSNWRNNGPGMELVEGLTSPRHDSRNSPSIRMDYTSPSHVDDQRSPRYASQRSPSPRVEMSSAPSRGKTSHGDWYEHSNSVSTSSGPQRRQPGPGLVMSDRRDRMKWHTGTEEEVKSGIFRANRNTDEGREGSLSPHRHRDQHLPAGPGKPPLHGQDNFPRGMGGRGTLDSRGDREHWRGGFDSPLDHHGPDDLSPRDRNERGRRMPMNRPPGSPMVRSQGSQLSSLPVPPLAPLPPPPPFRPGIDNPAVLGPLNGGFDDSSGSRDQGRGERKGGPLRRDGLGPGEPWRGVNVGNWNSRNQGPLPGNGFPQFPQFAPHPPGGGGGFPGMGQQFPGPPIFRGGGGRPPLDMGFGGGRFLGPGNHMGEGGDGYLGHGRGSGWHGPGDDEGRGPPLLGPVDGWEGPGPHGDDRLRHGRMEWERSGPMGVRGWERDRERDIWEGRGREGGPDFMPHRSQMEPPPQNPGFPPAGSGWGLPRDTQVSNDVKSRQERPPFDNQEAKRKPDAGPPKLKGGKPNGRAFSAGEGRLTKLAIATRKSILSQLDISPELAGPELYAQCCALVPDLEPGEEMDISEPADDDLKLEVDIEAEALIAGPDLIAKLFPLPEGLFEEAMRLYRKPETENRVLKSSRGSFVLPFDPSTINLPSISLKINRSHPVETKDPPPVGVARLLDHLDIHVVDGGFGEEFTEPRGEKVDVVEDTCQGLQSPQMEVAEVEDRKEEAPEDEFMSLRVEVAEYSDREFEAEMDDVLEEDIVKEVHGCGALSERLEPVGGTSEEFLVDSIPSCNKSIEPSEILVEEKQLVSLVDNNIPVEDVPRSDGVSMTGDQVDNVNDGTDLAENVNSLVVSKDAVNFGPAAEPEENYVVEEEGWVIVEGLEVMPTVEVLPQHAVEVPADIGEELSLETSVSKDLGEADGDSSVQNLKSISITKVEDNSGEGNVISGEFEHPGEVGVTQPMEIEGNGSDSKELSKAVGKEDIQNCLLEEAPSTGPLETDRVESNGELKEIAENPPTVHDALGEKEELQPEPLPRLRKRRASSRLQAQSSEAQAVASQEGLDGLVGQGSVGVKKVGTRGTTRSSQRKSKRRGSTH